MTTMTIVGEQTGEGAYVVIATPDHGNRIRFRVGKGTYSAGYSSRAGYLVMTATGGTITAHRTFETAVNAANKRAKRYVNAYSVPRKRTK